MKKSIRSLLIFITIIITTVITNIIINMHFDVTESFGMGGKLDIVPNSYLSAMGQDSWELNSESKKYFFFSFDYATNKIGTTYDLYYSVTFDDAMRKYIFVENNDNGEFIIAIPEIGFFKTVILGYDLKQPTFCSYVIQEIEYSEDDFSTEILVCQSAMQPICRLLITWGVDDVGIIPLKCDLINEF